MYVKRQKFNTKSYSRDNCKFGIQRKFPLVTQIARIVAARKPVFD